jgi:hypothetical protein
MGMSRDIKRPQPYPGFDPKRLRAGLNLPELPLRDRLTRLDWTRDVLGLLVDICSRAAVERHALVRISAAAAAACN